MGSDNFSSTIDLLKGYHVNLYVGEEIIKGKLMGVETDHLVLEDENQYVYYYNLDKIHAITKNTKQFQSEEITTDFMKTQSLRDLLNSLKNSWVSILCLNKQSFNGVLSIVDSDFATLINGEDRILVKISHIANILKGYRKEEESKNSSDDSENKQEDKQEDVSTNFVQEPVLSKESKKEARVSSREKVIKVEKEITPSSKVTINDSENDQKVWSEPIKNTVEKSIVVSTPKINNEMKKQKAETTHVESKYHKAEMKQSNLHENKQPAEIKQNNLAETKLKAEMKQNTLLENKLKAEMKQNNVHENNKQRMDVNQNPPKREKEISQKPPVTIKEQKAHVNEIARDAQSQRNIPAPKKDFSSRQTQELLNRVKKVKDSFEPQPLMKIEPTKKERIEKNSLESKQNDVKPVAQEVGAFRFAGEPSTRDFDRRSIFSGWPSRKSTPRRF
jgi:hypothetical protein